MIAALLLLSCSESKKVQKAINTLNAHPDKAAEYCGNKFPPRDSVVYHTDTLIKAHNIDHSGAIDTLSDLIGRIAAKATQDSLNAAQSHKMCRDVVADQAAENRKLRSEVEALKKSYVPCVPDTLEFTKTVYRANTAKEIDLGNKLAVSQTASQDYKDKWLWWMWACLITWGVIGLGVIVWVFRAKLGINKL